jgi:hypothetical protein
MLDGGVSASDLDQEPEEDFSGCEDASAPAMSSVSARLFHEIFIE